MMYLQQLGWTDGETELVEGAVEPLSKEGVEAEGEETVKRRSSSITSYSSGKENINNRKASSACALS